MVKPCKTHGFLQVSPSKPLDFWQVVTVEEAVDPTSPALSGLVSDVVSLAVGQKFLGKCWENSWKQ